MINTILTSAVVAAFISFLGTLHSNYTSRKITQETIAAEREKQKQLWVHEDAASDSAEFDEVIRCVTIWATAITRSTPETLAAIRLYRVKANGELAFALDALYESVSKGNTQEAVKLLGAVASARQGRSFHS